MGLQLHRAQRLKRKKERERERELYLARTHAAVRSAHTKTHTIRLLLLLGGQVQSRASQVPSREPLHVVFFYGSSKSPPARRHVVSPFFTRGTPDR